MVTFYTISMNRCTIMWVFVFSISDSYTNDIEKDYTEGVKANAMVIISLD